MVGILEISVDLNQEGRYLREPNPELQQSGSEILARGTWKASDHENWSRDFAVGVPQRYEPFRSLALAFISKGNSNSLFCSLLIPPNSSLLTPWLSTWKKPQSDDALTISETQDTRSSSFSLLRLRKSITGSSCSSTTWRPSCCERCRIEPVNRSLYLSKGGSHIMVFLLAHSAEG